jgi:hypothetical protein
LGEKLFRKLPGALGTEIMDRWNNSPGVVVAPLEKWSIGHRIQRILRILREKCTNIQIQKQLGKAFSILKVCFDLSP